MILIVYENLGNRAATILYNRYRTARCTRIFRNINSHAGNKRVVHQSIIVHLSSIYMYTYVRIHIPICVCVGAWVHARLGSTQCMHTYKWKSYRGICGAITSSGETNADRPGRCSSAEPRHSIVRPRNTRFIDKNWPVGIGR